MQSNNNGTTFTAKDIIRDIQRDVKEIRRDIEELKANYSVLNFKSTIWGAVGGSIPAAILALIYLLVSTK